MQIKISLNTTIIMLLLFTSAIAQAGINDGLASYWNFNEGTGDVLHDVSGGGNDGKIIGAKWVKNADGYALSFDGNGSYVDFGDNQNIKISRDYTFSAWIKSDADPYPNETTNWHIFNWEKYRNSGMALRIAGTTGQLYLRVNQADGRFQDGYSESNLSNRTFYHVVIVKRGEKTTLFLDGKPNVEFKTSDPSANNDNFTLSGEGQAFAGVMDNIRIYKRAIDAGEVVALFSENASENDKDTSWIGKMVLTPFIYDDEKKATVEANFRGVMPIQPNEKILVELRRDGKTIEMIERTSAPESAVEDYVFDLNKLATGKYEISVSIRDTNKIRVSSSINFNYPFDYPLPPVPSAQILKPLPAPVKPPSYKLEVSDNGGFTVVMGNNIFSINSFYSFPFGGENKFSVAGLETNSGESSWKVQTRKTGKSIYQVTASGKFYKITRHIEAQASRVLIKDKIENLTNAIFGMTVDNRIDANNISGAEFYAPAAPAPPIFVRTKSLGLGLVPLNDVYQMLQRTSVENHTGGSKIVGLGIDKGGSHTLEWAVYPVGTTDYFDLINAIRKDEKLNGLTIDGCLSITHSGRWLREPPPEELVKFGGIKYMSSGCVTHIADDPEISIEGIEFTKYPKECEALKKTYDENKKLFPGLKMGFHVAYNIFANNDPETKFADSQVTTASGKHEMYGNFEGYFSKTRIDQGWAWYPYYPTLTNSFGKEFLRSVDVMMDEMGVNMVWADGLLSGYGAATGDFPTTFVSTANAWDGYSAELDKITKNIVRTWGQVAGLGKEALVKYIHKINDKGGRVWINHMATVPYTFAHQKAYWAAETNDGDFRIAPLLLSPAPHGLAHPSKHDSMQAIYNDIRSKLSWGSLYVYYWYGGASQITHRMITADMYPITLEEIHSGIIKGQERIITTNPGVYGWPGSKKLHFTVLYDGRGHPAPNSFLSTADKSGIRTNMELKQNETAILKKIPVSISADKPVNIICKQYDSKSIKILLNGQGKTFIQIQDGDFKIKPNSSYQVVTNKTILKKSDSKGRLSLPIMLNGQVNLTISDIQRENK